MWIPCAIFIAAFLDCIRTGGEQAPNAFGPEFGDIAGTVEVARASLDTKRNFTIPSYG